jgi:hypothetical protein
MDNFDQHIAPLGRNRQNNRLKMFGDNLDSFEEEKSENNRESKKRKNFYYE